VAHTLEAEIKRIPGTRDVFSVGGAQDIVHVELDPERVAGFGLTLEDLRLALQAGNDVRQAGSLVADETEIPVQTGVFLSGPQDVAKLVVGVFGGRPVYLGDVARISGGSDQPEQYAWFATGPAHDEAGHAQVGYAPAVTLSISKKPGTNATRISNAVIQRLDELSATHIPEGVEATITRNYGQTANDKAIKLISKLAFATASVILLVLITLGWREAIIVGSAVVVTLMVTLFASWAWGFTINRVSLFALIFSIGILVDDAIVVVENIHRHRGMKSGPLASLIPGAVDEVGGPTILATFTVIAALLPMAFVTGLMGPYMSPIPINASMGMLFSLGIALVLTPWLSNHLLSKTAHPAPTGGKSNRLHDFFERLMTPFLRKSDGKGARTGRPRPTTGRSPTTTTRSSGARHRRRPQTTTPRSRWPRSYSSASTHDEIHETRIRPKALRPPDRAHPLTPFSAPAMITPQKTPPCAAIPAWTRALASAIAPISRHTAGKTTRATRQATTSQGRLSSMRIGPPVRAMATASESTTPRTTTR